MEDENITDLELGTLDLHGPETQHQKDRLDPISKPRPKDPKSVFLCPLCCINGCFT